MTSESLLELVTGLDGLLNDTEFTVGLFFERDTASDESRTLLFSTDLARSLVMSARDLERLPGGLETGSFIPFSCVKLEMTSESLFVGLVMEGAGDVSIAFQGSFFSVDSGWEFIFSLILSDTPDCSIFSFSPWIFISSNPNPFLRAGCLRCCCC